MRQTHIITALLLALTLVVSTDSYAVEMKNSAFYRMEEQMPGSVHVRIPAWYSVDEHNEMCAGFQSTMTQQDCYITLTTQSGHVDTILTYCVNRPLPGYRMSVHKGYAQSSANENNTVTVKEGETSYYISCVDEDDAHWMDFTWHAPAEYAGQQVSLSVINYTYQMTYVRPAGEIVVIPEVVYQPKESYKFKLLTTTLPSIDGDAVPQLITHNIADPEHEMQIMIPWTSTSHKVSDYVIWGKSGNGSYEKYGDYGRGTVFQVEPAANAGMAYIDVDNVQRSVFLQMTLLYNNDPLLPFTVNSDTLTVDAYHYPRIMSTSGSVGAIIPYGNCFDCRYYSEYDKKENPYLYRLYDARKYGRDYTGAVAFVWEVLHPLEPDIMENDMFEVQRIQEGGTEWESIGIMQMVNEIPQNDPYIYYDREGDKMVYTYVDSSDVVMKAYKNEDPKSRSFFYRVRRTSAAIWTEGTAAFSQGSVDMLDVAIAQCGWKTSQESSYDPALNLVAKKAADWETSRRVELTANPLYNTDGYGTGVPYFGWDGTPFILTKKMINGHDTIYTDITIPNDSVRKVPHMVRTYIASEDGNLVYDSVAKGYEYKIHYTDVAELPCVKYEYFISADLEHSRLIPSSRSRLYSDLKNVEYTRVPIPDRTPDDSLYYDSGMKLVSLTGSDRVSPDFTSLSWTLEGGGFDYYEVWRKSDTVGYDGHWTKVTTTQDLYYVDRKAPIGIPCMYKVIGYSNCYAANNDSIYGTGWRDCYGSVSGNVSFPDGIVCAGVEVIAADENGHRRSAFTDEQGNYTIDSLLFSDQSTLYYVSVQDKYQSVYKTAAGGQLPYTIALDGTTAIITHINFVNTSFVRFEGRVLYEHSTVPVAHAQFVVNGKKLVNAAGEAMETDASGNFDLMVQQGRTSIRVVKEGHTFANNGYFTDEAGDSIMALDDNVYGQRIYDLTRVNVIGRVTGGLPEGSKPLGRGLSVNTLGDSITLVLELEGDNISHLVNYPTNRDIQQVDTVFRHIYSCGETSMTTTTKRITVHPDRRTGEYQIALFPVKYKVVQASATGYATLFPSGTTAQTLDLSACITPKGYFMDTTIRADHTVTIDTLAYHEIYSITYRAPVELTYTQEKLGMQQNFFGEEKMKATNIYGKNNTVSLVSQDSLTREINYLFGYPVFLSGSKYDLTVGAREAYYYNNDRNSANMWEVYLDEGEITLYNGFSQKNETLTASIDPRTKRARISVPVNNTSFVLTGEQALRKVEMRINVNGLYVYATPLQGYIAGQRIKGTETVKTLNSDICILDCIRDPYGANSYAYVDKGTTYSTTYKADWKFELGVDLGIKVGNDVTASTGVVAAPMGAGAYTGTVSLKEESMLKTDIPLAVSWEGYENASYTFTTSERISTSSDKTMVGACADVYLGVTTNMYAGLLDAVNIIDSTTYRLKQPAIEAGKIRVLATPQDNAPYYLVVSELVEIGQTAPVTFAYTQCYIMKTLLPRLVQERNALIMTGSPEELQALADSMGIAIYGSKVAPESDAFGVDTAVVQYKPSHKPGNYVNDVNRYNRLIMSWVNVIANNEKRKVEAPTKGKLLKTYSITTDADIQYSETASHAYGNDYQFNALKPLLGSAVTKIVPGIATLIKSAIDKEVNFTVFGVAVKLDFDLISNLDMQDGVIQSEGSSKTAGFVLSTSGSGYEDIVVYRLTDTQYNSDNEDTRDIAVDSGSEKVGDQLNADYVFLRKGGATRCPYEDEETTIFYQRGNAPEILGVKTIKIDDPRISINVHEISNVPADQPAIFVLTLSNEGNAGSPSLLLPKEFRLIQEETSNPDGLKMYIDGVPLIETSYYLKPGQSIQKTLEVYRGNAYDYDNVYLRFYSDCDTLVNSLASFNVHYQPVSCPVAIALPVQNWIMNTLSPKDDDGYYLPVEISGFDVNYDNFDHIDLQYKLQTQSDDQWVTQCSFYADSVLYQRASGVKAMITNGQIRNVKFHGERDPMEQHYDLRAVSFCRFGNGFITRASELRSGFKDTRVPQLFGAAEPANGILRVGDYIHIPFSEPIADNYLDEDNNFEITGYTNSSALSHSTSIHFPGDPAAYAETELSRNLSNRDFTIDLTVKPDAADRSMTYVCHGNEDTYMTLGQEYTATGQYITLRIANHVRSVSAGSKPVTIPTNEWSHIVAAYHTETGSVDFYLNGKDVTSDDNITYNHYDGFGPLLLGVDAEDSRSSFAGNMHELRLWSHALNAAEVLATTNRQLTGYESGLVDYWPVNEGKGTVAEDISNGMKLNLHGLSWNHPEGSALMLKGDTLRMDGSFFPSSLGSDFTYSMWFRLASSPDTVNLFHSATMELMITDKTVILREKSGDITVYGSYMDNNWHQLAVSANHATGDAAIYVDGVNATQFNAANIAGPSDSEMQIGPMQGEIDEITYWEMALPAYYLQTFYDHTPNNNEMGLITHLSFSQRVLAEDGSKYTTEYNPYNERIRYDERGNVAKRTENDRVILNPDNQFASSLAYNAPIREKGDLVKLGFNWVGKDNELVIDLKMQDSEINKQNIFVTVRDVEDLAGNPMKSPLSWTLFVDVNRLRWSSQYLQKEIKSGESASMNVDIVNQGGQTMNYYIRELPQWLSVSSERGQLSPLEQKPLTLRVSDKMNPGTYTATIYLTDDNNLCEPLDITVDVKAVRPNWQVNPLSGNGSTMNVIAQALMEGANASRYYVTDTADIVAAYLGNICIGVEHVLYNQGKSLICMSFMGSDDKQFTQLVKAKCPIRFMLWHASTGQIFTLKPLDDNAVYYSPNTIAGTPDEPVQLISTNIRTQEISLRPGWNWVSFYLDPDRNESDFTYTMTDESSFSEGDFIKWLNSSQSYEGGMWQGMSMQFYKDYIYMFRTQEEEHIGIRGTTIPANELCVSLNQGWNHLPYLCEQVQDISTALSDYTTNYATPGDIVKGYHFFAMLNKAYHWEGSLTHLIPGEGYLLYRQGKEPVVMRYQSLAGPEQTAPQAAPAVPFRFSHNMPVIATVANAHKGDILQAYCGRELVGEAVADENGVFMLMTSAEENSMLQFRLLSADGIQVSEPVVRYRSASSAVGTVDNPYEIHFDSVVTNDADADDMPYKWIHQGIMYIYRNGKVYDATGQTVRQIAK